MLFIRCIFHVNFSCGFCGFGLLPLGNELVLENTYPVDPAAGLSLMFAVSQLSGTVLIGIAGALEQDATASIKKHQVSGNDQCLP